MPILISIGGNGSGIAIRNEHNFENIAARDIYFPTKKGELISNETYVWTKDTGQLYKWTGISNPEEYDVSLFKEVTPVVKGERGLPGETSYDAKTAETLKTPRKINGVEFDGSKDIFIPKSPDDVDKEYVDTELTKKANTLHTHTKTEVGLDNVDNTRDINKNVLSATKLTNARKINGIEFDGTKDITLPNGAGSATFLGLADVPNSYLGEKGKVVRVKSDESGLEFVTNVGDVTKTYVDDELLKKANSTHSHSKTDITDFPKISAVGVSGSYDDLLNKPTVDVDKLYVDTELGKKSNTSHKHVKSDITDFPTLSTVATSGSYLDLINKPTIPTVDVTKSYVDGELNKKANSSHSHVISDVSELKTNLDSKADKTTTYTKTEVDGITSKKVDVMPGKQLSTEDYSSSDKNKVDKINTGGVGEKFLADNGVYKNIISGVSSVNSKTGEVNINKNDIGLGNIDNTSDINKPVSTLTQTALNGKEDKSNKGLVNGYASLDSNGKVPSSQLPSYVDDVIEVASFSSLPTTGETGKIYVTIDTNKCYRWGNTTYVPIVSGNVDSVNSKTGDVIIAKSDIGLSNVDNTSDKDKPISTATQNALNNKSNSTHKHVISDISDLQTSLDSKSDKTTTYTKTEVDSSIGKKVDKVTGKSLILDTEINRLSTVTNYTHPTTHPSSMITGLSAVATSGSYLDLINKPNIPTVDVTKAYVDGELNKKANTTHGHTISEVTNLQLTLDGKANASTVYTKTEVDSKDNLKVDKTITINSKALNTNIVLTKSDVGLSNVDNTSDLNKPMSTDTKNYIDNAPYIKLKSLSSGTSYLDLESGMYYLQQPSVSDGYPPDVQYAYMIVTDRYWMLIERDKGKRYYKYAQSNGNSSTWIEDVDKKYVDDALVSKVEKVSGKSLIADSEITRLSTVTNYTHPSTHQSSMITGLSTVATSGKYSDLTGVPIIDVNKKYVDDALLGKADVKQYYGSTPYNMLPVGFFYVTNCTVENGYPPNVTSAWVTKTNGEFFLTDRATGKQYFRYNNNGGVYEP